MKQKSLETLIKEIAPKELAAGLIRAEVEREGADLRMYSKGAKSMLQNFVSDADFVAAVIDEFDKLTKLSDFSFDDLDITLEDLIPEEPFPIQ